MLNIHNRKKSLSYFTILNQRNTHIDLKDFTALLLIYWKKKTIVFNSCGNLKVNLKKKAYTVIDIKEHYK